MGPHPDPHAMAMAVYPVAYTGVEPDRGLADAYADGARAERVRMIAHLRTALAAARGSGSTVAAVAIRIMIDDLTASLM